MNATIPSKRPFLFLALGLVVGIGFGWCVLGPRQRPTPEISGGQQSEITPPAPVAKPPNLSGMNGQIADLEGLDLWRRLEAMTADELEAAANARTDDRMAYRASAAAVAQLSTLDPARAFTVALRLQQSEIIAEAFAAFVTADPEAAARALTDLDPDVARSTAIDAPKGQLALNDGVFPTGAWPKLLAALGRSLPDRALELAMARSGRDTRVLSEFLTELSALDRPTAARIAEKLPGSTATHAAQLSLVKSWAEEDPSTSLAWARQHLGAKQYHTAQRAVIGTLSTAELVEVVDQLPPGAAQPAACRTIAERWITENPAECLAWARALPSPAQRVAALAAAAEKLAAKDPAQALLLVNELPDPARQRGLAVKAVATWAKTDPTAAMAYATKIDDPATRQACIEAAKPVPLPDFPPNPPGASSRRIVSPDLSMPLPAEPPSNPQKRKPSVQESLDAIKFGF